MAKRKSTAPKAKAANVGKDPEVKIESALGKTEMWFEKNWKTLSAIALVALVVAGGIYAYIGLHKIPQGRKAGEAMYVAQQLFAQGDYATALHGDGNNLGFADVADTYRGTPQGRLAAHYAGIAYLKEGDQDAALEYLGRYRATRGAPNRLINAQNKGLIGDIHADRGDYTAAIANYRKAVAAADNILTTPMYLKKLGLAYDAAGNYAEAVKAYRRIADEYPASIEARDIAKYAAAAEQKI